MGELVKIAAMAMYRRRILERQIYPPGDPRLEAAVEQGWPLVEGEARDAVADVLDAIAEPSEAQLAAGIKAILQNAMRGNLLEIEAVVTYRAMIAALRKEIESE